MANEPEYSNIVKLWQDIKEDIPDLLVTAFNQDISMGIPLAFYFITKIMPA